MLLLGGAECIDHLGHLAGDGWRVVHIRDHRPGEIAVDAGDVGKARGCGRGEPVLDHHVRGEGAPDRHRPAGGLQRARHRLGRDVDHPVAGRQSLGNQAGLDVDPDRTVGIFEIAARQTRNL